MKIEKPSIELIDPPDYQEMLLKVEEIGRTCYRSTDLITSGSAEKFSRGIILRGHESVIEHAIISVRIICDRGVSHEIVRHRIASFCQESTRYCNYSKGKFGGEITVIEPCYLKHGTALYEIWRYSCIVAERAYIDMIADGATAQEARAVLPNSLKTDLVMTANIREWRHFLKLRCDKAAHPQMREVAEMIRKELTERYPVFFEDLKGEIKDDASD